MALNPAPALNGMIRLKNELAMEIKKCSFSFMLKGIDSVLKNSPFRYSPNKVRRKIGIK